MGIKHKVEWEVLIPICIYKLFRTKSRSISTDYVTQDSLDAIKKYPTRFPILHGMLYGDRVIVLDPYAVALVGKEISLLPEQSLGWRSIAMALPHLPLIFHKHPGWSAPKWWGLGIEDECPYAKWPVYEWHAFDKWGLRTEHGVLSDAELLTRANQRKGCPVGLDPAEWTRIRQSAAKKQKLYKRALKLRRMKQIPDKLAK